MEDIIKLNVGGRVFVTKRCTLCAYPDSLLGQIFDPESKFASPAEIDGFVFIDRDPSMFELVLNYLRGSNEYITKLYIVDLLKLKCEADYFSLHHLLSKVKDIIPLKEEQKKGAFKTKLNIPMRVDSDWDQKLGKWNKAEGSLEIVASPSKLADLLENDSRGLCGESSNSALDWWSAATLLRQIEEGSFDDNDDK